MKLKHRSREQILLLLAEGFSEAEATFYISELRGAGLSVKTVGLTKRPVRSEHGVEIVPDLTIDGVIHRPPNIKLLILPSGRAAIEAWRADPRTQLLIDMMWKRGGYLVAASELIEMLESIIKPELSLQLYAEPSIAYDAKPSTIPVMVAPAAQDALLKEFVRSLVLISCD